jgi:hypothetical protein
MKKTIDKNKLNGIGIILVIAAVVAFMFCRQEQETYYIDKLGLYVKTKRNYSECTFYFSRNTNFGSDYITYNNNHSFDRDIYFLPPNKLYIINVDDVVVKIHNKEFLMNVIEYNMDSLVRHANIVVNDSALWQKTAYVRYSQDSIFIKEPHYVIHTFEWCNGFIIFDPNSKVIFDTDNPRN